MDKYYFYQSYYYSLKGLKPTVRYAIREAIDDFMFEDKEPDFKDALSNSIWMLLLPTLKLSKVRYANGKQTKSKTEAKPKQNENKQEAKSEQTQSKSEGNPQVCPSISKEKGERIKEYNKPPKSPKGYSEEFEKFWKAYPRNDAKQDGFKAFNKAIKETTLDTLLKSVEAFKNTESWQRDDGKYIPYASSWLNGKRWLDDLPTAEPPKKKDAPHVTECPVCHSDSISQSLDRFICNSCNLVWDWNREAEKWEVTL